MNDGDRTTTTKKIGLVLEGGGAKGAYALGWLRAFEAKGVVFDTVAGTSAGGLNAIILATGKLNYGKMLWRRIAFRTTYAPRFPRLLYVVLALCNTLLFIARRFFVHAGSLFQLVGFPLFLGLFLLICIYLPTVLIISLIMWDWEVFTSLLLGTVPMLIKIIVLPVLAFGLIICVLEFSPTIGNQLGFTLLNPSPLKSDIAQFLHNATLRCPIYLAIATEQYAFDEETAVEERAGPTGPVIGHWARRKFIPCYVKLNDLTSEDRISAALATAALPFGIVPAVRLDGKWYVDGGVVDNVPVYPLVSIEKPDIVVVVRLNHEVSDEEETVQERYKKRWMKAAEAMADIKRPHYQGAFDESTAPPVLPPETWPRFIEVKPDRPLGGALAFLTFFRWFTIPIERRGWRDAWQKPEDWWRQLKT